MVKTVIPERNTRAFAMRMAARDDGGFDISFSSEAPVQRFFGKEILVHEPGAIDLSRAEGGLPLLVNHDSSLLIGRVSDIRLEARRLRGVMMIDAEEDTAKKWRGLVERDVARDVSVQYAIQQHETTERESGPDEVRITRWQPLEVSLVAVAADASVGVGRAATRSTDDNQTRGDTMSGDNDTGVNATEHRIAFQQGEVAGQARGAEAERERIQGIAELFSICRDKGPIYDALQQRCIAEGSTVEQARSAIFSLQNSEPQSPVTAPVPDSHGRAVPNGEDSADKFVRGVTEALMVRCGLEKDPKVIASMGENPYAGMRLVEIGRSYLGQLGINAGAMSPSDVAVQSLRRSGLISHTSSDFTDILANISNKSLGAGYMQAPETWRPFCRVMSLSDYKQAKIANLTSFSSLDRIYEGGEYKSGTIGDVGEPITLRKYGKRFSLTRELILGDDLDALSRVPMKMGQAAARVPGDLVYNEILLANPTLSQDSVALFAAGHSNYVAGGSGAAPSTTTLDAAYTAMGTQTDPDSNATLNLTPRYLIVPKALRGVAMRLTSATIQAINPGVTNAVATMDARNEFQDLEVISEARIDASDAAKWFLAADPSDGLTDTIAVAFLNGQDMPSMEQQDGWVQDGVEYKVRLEVTAAPVAYQGLYHNDGN